MSDFDIQSHLQRMGFGQGGPKNPKADKTNEETPFDQAAEGAGQELGGIPSHLGLPLDLSELGTAGLQRALGGDTEGITGKTIMPSILPDAQGGFIAKILHAVFIKNREVTDHTQGVGGGAGIEGGHYGDGGHHHGDFSAIAGSSSNYPDYPMIDLGGTGNFSALSDLPAPLPMETPIISNRGGPNL